MWNSTKSWLCYSFKNLLYFLIRYLAWFGFHNASENQKVEISLISFSVGLFSLYVTNILRVRLIWLGPTFVNLFWSKNFSHSPTGIALLCPWRNKHFYLPRCGKRFHTCELPVTPVSIPHPPGRLCLHSNKLPWLPINSIPWLCLWDKPNVLKTVCFVLLPAILVMSHPEGQHVASASPVPRRGTRMETGLALSDRKRSRVKVTSLEDTNGKRRIHS